MNQFQHSSTLAFALLFAASLPASSNELDKTFPSIERGRYLTTVGDCIACHTAPGGKPFAGGLAIETPFGKIVSPNITPDRKTGIGAWSDAAFRGAMKEGIDNNGNHLYPAFPYQYYTRVSDKDVIDIRSYLNTLEPVSNEVVSNQLPFPFNIRTSLIGWNLINFTAGDFKPNAQKSEEWNRGAYLVEGLGHCAACHTPKNITGGDKGGLSYNGGVIQNWYAPALTNDNRVGLGKWTEAEVVDYLKTGHNQYAAASGPMAEVVGYSTSQMSYEDLSAIAVYLKQFPEKQTSVAAFSKTDAGFIAGKDIYQASCSACHSGNGKGVLNMLPALAESGAVQSDDPTSLIRVILNGAQSVATTSKPTGAAMPSFSWKYSDAQIANVLNYIRNDFGNSANPVSASQVKKLRATLEKENH